MSKYGGIKYFYKKNQKKLEYEKVDGEYIETTDEQFNSEKTYYELTNSGKIIANDIEIGIGAIIKEYIKFKVY